MKKHLLLLCLSVAWLFTGCASVDLASDADSAKAKEFTIDDSSKSQLYVYRPGHIAGSALKKAIWIDGLYVGRLKRCSFLVEKIEPGEHVISTESEFGNNEILINTEANKNYFVRQNIKFGVFVGGSSIHEVSVEKGMEDVKKCELIEAQRKESVNINPADIEKARAELKAQQ